MKSFEAFADGCPERVTVHAGNTTWVACAIRPSENDRCSECAAYYTYKHTAEVAEVIGYRLDDLSERISTLESSRILDGQSTWKGLP